MDIDETTLKALSEIQKVLQESYADIERLEYLSHHIIKGRVLLVLLILVVAFSTQWWFILLVLPFGYIQLTHEMELKELRTKEFFNLEKIKEKSNELQIKFNLKFNSQYSFIYSFDSEKRLHLDTGNWVPYYE